MFWTIVVILVVAGIIHSGMGKRPSAVHDPSGYSSHIGCTNLLGFVTIVLIVIVLVLGS
jgi:hypothetical protein